MISVNRYSRSKVMCRSKRRFFRVYVSANRIEFHANHLLSNAMGRGKDPLIGDENSGAIEDLLGAAEEGREKRPITRS